METCNRADNRSGSNAASWLALAASPTFAVMAWLANSAPVFCSSGSNMLPIDSMAGMYLLMSLFHLSPWLKLAFGLNR